MLNELERKCVLKPNLTISKMTFSIHDLLSNERLSNEVLSMFLLSKRLIIELYFYRSPKNVSYYRRIPAGVQGAAAP